MIYGTGTDIIEIERIKKAIEKDSFIKRYFTEKEFLYFKSKSLRPETIAGNFAAKEAISKALGTGFSGFEPIELEILRDEKGMPFVNTFGKAKNFILYKNISKIFISISHNNTCAIAMAVAEEA